MSSKELNLLVLCTGNSCRSIMGEALINQLGKGRFKGYSAGSHPIGRINTGALATLARHGLPVQGYKSKSWDEFADTPMDILISVCDSAGRETCPVYLGPAIRGHWGVADPGHVTGTQEEIVAAFDETFATLRRRFEALVELPVETMGREQLGEALMRIGKEID